MTAPKNSSSRPTAAQGYQPPRRRWAGLLAVGVLGSGLAAVAWSSFNAAPQPAAPPVALKAPAPTVAATEPEAPAVLASSDKPQQEAVAAPAPAPRVQAAAAPTPQRAPTLVAQAPRAREIVESAPPALKPPPEPVAEPAAPSAAPAAAPASAPD